jgi:osmotically-inducible protein OsmY
MLGALVFALATGGGVAAANDNDDRLERKIESRFELDKKLKGHDLDVDVDEGVATLKGKVSSEGERVRAEKLARVAGVSRIDNKLEIDTSVAKERIEDNARMAKKRIDDRAERAKDRIDAQEDRSKERIDERAKARADYRDDVRRDTVRRDKDDDGNEVTDAWITTKVKARFVGVDALEGSDISVDTNDNGVVTLTGTVPSEAARTRALEIVRTTKGVHKINDQLRLAPAK